MKVQIKIILETFVWIICKIAIFFKLTFKQERWWWGQSYTCQIFIRCWQGDCGSCQLTPWPPTFLSDQPLTRIARIWVTSMTRYIWPGWFWGSQKPMWKYLCLRVYGNGWMTENSFLAAFEKIMRVRLPKFAASSIIQIAIWKSETLSYLAFCNKPRLPECKCRP